MFQEMKEHSLRCDELVYNTLMEGCWASDFGAVPVGSSWTGQSSMDYWLVVWNIIYFSIYWEYCNHPN